MKNISLTIIICICMQILWPFYSCKKESWQNGNNTATSSYILAYAGNDTTYQWPIDSIVLDGSKSTMLNDSIGQYYWTKKSGPNATITQPLNKITSLTNIEFGDYTFELTVKSSKGNTSKTSITIRFNYNCKEIQLNILKGPGILTSLGKIPNSYGNMSPSLINNNIYIPHISKSSYGIDFLDTYDILTDTWKKAIPPLNLINFNPIITGKYMLFYSYTGNKLIYDTEKLVWINVNRISNIDQAITAYENLFFSAGGINSYLLPSNDIYITDLNNNSTIEAKLSQNRGGIGIAGHMNKVFFAGGYTRVQPLGNYYDDVIPSELTSIVDIYDIPSKTMSSTALSWARYNITVKAAGDKVLFAGGYSLDNNGLTQYSDRLDIYDVPSKTWTSTSAIYPFDDSPNIFIINNNVYFVNLFFTGRNKIQIYNLINNQWSTLNFPGNSLIGSVAVAGNKIAFTRSDALSQSTNFSNSIDLYDTSTNIWTEIILSMGYQGTILSDGKQFYLAGGYLSNPPPGCQNCYTIPIPSCGLYKISF